MAAINFLAHGPISKSLHASRMVQSYKNACPTDGFEKWSPLYI